MSYLGTSPVGCGRRAEALQGVQIPRFESPSPAYGDHEGADVTEGNDDSKDQVGNSKEDGELRADYQIEHGEGECGDIGRDDGSQGSQ